MKKGRRELVFIAPDDTERGWTVAVVYMMRSETDWAVPGEVSGWDGNEKRPTLHGSVWLLDGKGWHGFIENGNLRTAKPLRARFLRLRTETPDSVATVGKIPRSMSPE